MAPGAHEHAGFVLAGLYQLGAGGLNENGDPIVVGVPALAPSAEGHDDVMVLPMGVRLGKNFLTRSGPMNTTSVRCSSSAWVMKRPSATFKVRTSPKLGVAPIIMTFSMTRSPLLTAWLWSSSAATAV